MICALAGRVGDLSGTSSGTGVGGTDVVVSSGVGEKVGVGVGVALGVVLGVAVIGRGWKGVAVASDELAANEASSILMTRIVGVVVGRGFPTSGILFDESALTEMVSGENMIHADPLRTRQRIKNNPAAVRRRKERTTIIF